MTVTERVHGTTEITCIHRQVDGIETDPTVLARFEVRLPRDEADTIQVGRRYTMLLDPIGEEA